METARISKDKSELFILMVKLLRENKFADVVISNSRCIKSIAEFNNINEMMNYTESTYADSILIKKNGRNAYTERIYFHHFKGFTINEKSVTIYTTNPADKKSRYGFSKNIKF